jgi:hypothetical protein
MMWFKLRRPNSAKSRLRRAPEKAAEQMEKSGVRQEVVQENIDLEKMFHELA